MIGDFNMNIFNVVYAFFLLHEQIAWFAFSYSISVPVFLKLSDCLTFCQYNVTFLLFFSLIASDMSKT